MKSILKSTPPFHHDQEIIMCQSPSDIAAYKKGLRHALDPITEDQKKILTIAPGALQYLSMKEWFLPSPRTGKSISINPTAQVKTGNKITLQPLDQQGKKKLKSSAFIRVDFIALDFSPAELFMSQH